MPNTKGHLLFFKKWKVRKPLVTRSFPCQKFLFETIFQNIGRETSLRYMITSGKLKDVLSYTAEKGVGAMITVDDAVVAYKHFQAKHRWNFAGWDNLPPVNRRLWVAAHERMDGDAIINQPAARGDRINAALASFHATLADGLSHIRIAFAAVDVLRSRIEAEAVTKEELQFVDDLLFTAGAILLSSQIGAVRQEIARLADSTTG
jgi:hypothetical protein